MSKIVPWAVIVVLALTRGDVRAATFTGLGVLSGGSSSSAWGVSADGEVVVGDANNLSGNVAFRWTSSGGMVSLGDFSGSTVLSQATDVSADGAVAVGYGTPTGGTEAFRWTSGSGLEHLGDLAGGSFFSVARGVSADGSVVVGRSSSTSGTQAFRWDEFSGMVGLGFMSGGSASSQATDVSADGSVIVGYNQWGLGYRAFRWMSSGGFTNLGLLGGIEAQAYGVSPEGNVVVGYATNNNSAKEAFRWTIATGMVSLGDLPGGPTNAWANAASSNGAVVVGLGTGASGGAAFIWDATNGMRSLQDVLVNNLGLNLAGWTLTEARAISPDARYVVGYGNHTGTNEAFIADLSSPPAPTAEILAITREVNNILVTWQATAGKTNTLQATGLPAGLVSWWRAENNATDSAGGNNGTLQNGATFAVAKAGAAFSLDGLDDYVSIGNPANLKITGSLTLAAWVNPSDFPQGEFVAVLTKWAQSLAGDSYGMWLYNNGGVVEVFGSVNDGVAPVNVVGGIVPSNVWTHIAMTYNSLTGTNAVYVNGAVVASIYRPGGIATSDQNVQIGHEDSGAPRPFPGMIDDVQIFNRALSSNEVAAIYNSKESFRSNEFSDLFTVTNSTGSATNYLDVGACDNYRSRFYRIKVLP